MTTEDDPNRWLGENSDTTARVHASVNCLAGLTPVSGVLYSGHQPPMFSPSSGAVLPETLSGSWNDGWPSNSKSSCTEGGSSEPLST